MEAAAALPERFRALRVDVSNDGGDADMRLADCRPDDLPDGDLTVAVQWSSLNYKDALSAQGNRGVTRSYPHTPGIDAAGVTVATGDPAPGNRAAGVTVATGDAVIVQGRDFGMNTWGGWSEYIRVPADWAVPLPPELSPRQAMAYGTAGFTAALAIERLEQAGLRACAPDLPVLVTGAGGGLGSIAVAMLAACGYRVTACTGKAGTPVWERYLQSLGADQVIPRAELEQDAERPIARRRWRGGIDTTGGSLLAALVKGCAYGATVAACGLTQSAELPLTVYPFILRSVSLLGVDSAEVDRSVRTRVWSRIAGDLRCPAIEEQAQAVSLGELPATVAQLINGEHGGRTVVQVQRDTSRSS